MWRAIRSSSHIPLQRCQHRSRRGIHCDGIAAQRSDLCSMPCNLVLIQQCSAMEVDGVVGVFERVPGEQENHSLGGGTLFRRPAAS